MTSREPYAEPSTVSARVGSVHVDGPDSVDVTLTPEAARKTGERLQRAAVLAADKTDPANDLE